MSVIIHFPLVFLLWYNLVLTTMSDVDLNRYNEGKHQYELLRYKSEMPRYGQCWTDAMTTIQTGCKRLTDETQTRLALAYLNCFLMVLVVLFVRLLSWLFTATSDESQLQDLESYPCYETMDIRDCTKSLRESDQSSFTTFFTHTQNICYFLQAQMWHQETELTISRLADRSSQVASQLETAQRLQEDMLNSQSESLRNQEQLMDGTHTLRGIINSSLQNVRSLFEDLKTSTLEQRQMMGDVFNQLINLQSTILGEVSGFYSLFFYILFLLVCYLLTSTARTAGARLWLFLVMTVNIVMEQTMMRWIAGGKVDSEQLYWLQKQCRQFSMLVAVAIIIGCAYMYRDVNELNNQLLTEIRKQNSDIKRFISGQTPKPSPDQPSSTPATSKHGQTPKPSPDQPSSTPATSKHDLSSDSDYTSDDVDDDDDGDESDRTFILDQTSTSSLSDDDDIDGLSFNDSIANGDMETSRSSLFSELHDLRSATPVREMEGRVSTWLSQSQSGNIYNESPAKHSYNLRNRTAVPPEQKTSPALKVESPRSFSRTVRQLQQVSEKNSRILRAEIGRSNFQNVQQHEQQSSSSPGRPLLHHQTPTTSNRQVMNAAGDNRNSSLVSSSTSAVRNPLIIPAGQRLRVDDEGSVGSRSSRGSRTSRQKY